MCAPNNRAPDRNEGRNRQLNNSQRRQNPTFGSR